MPAKPANRAKPLDTAAILQSPMDANDVANLNSVGAIEDNWTEAGRVRINIGQGTSGPAVVGGQLQDVLTFDVEMNRRTLKLDWIFLVISGPYKGQYLYPYSIGGDARSRRMTVICSTVRIT